MCSLFPSVLRYPWSWSRTELGRRNSINYRVILKISGQVRRKPWNWGQIRRFFGLEFQVFVIKSAAKASNKKKSLQLDIWSRRESDSPLMMWILPKLQSLHRALMKVWWCLSLLKRRHLPHPRWRLSSYKGQNYSVSWLALLANYYLLKLSGGINTYDSCEMSQRSELMLRVQKCNKKGHAR
jgi:hypothetical protein